MGIQLEKWGARTNDMGQSVFPETDPISLLFRFAYIPFVIHRDEYRVTRGSAVLGFPGGSEVKVSASNVGDPDLIPGSGRSPGEGNGNPLQYLAWKIPWTEECHRLQSMRLQRVGHD